MSAPYPTRISIAVQTADIDQASVVDAITTGDSGIGALVSFIGLVRDQNLGSGVAALELEHYPGMTEKALRAIADEAATRWSLHAISIVHRVGKLQPTDRIVLVVTAGSHRHSAFEANTFIMDYLKTRAPFWKKEWTPQGARWVDARESDFGAAARWHEVVSKTYGYDNHD